MTTQTFTEQVQQSWTVAREQGLAHVQAVLKASTRLQERHAGHARESIDDLARASRATVELVSDLGDELRKVLQSAAEALAERMRKDTADETA